MLQAISAYFVASPPWNALGWAGTLYILTASWALIVPMAAAGWRRARKINRAIYRRRRWLASSKTPVRVGQRWVTLCACGCSLTSEDLIVGEVADNSRIFDVVSASGVRSRATEQVIKDGIRRNWAHLGANVWPIPDPPQSALSGRGVHG